MPIFSREADGISTVKHVGRMSATWLCGFLRFEIVYEESRYVAVQDCIARFDQRDHPRILKTDSKCIPEDVSFEV